jgi:hypothetical protein
MQKVQSDGSGLSGPTGQLGYPRPTFASNFAKSRGFGELGKVRPHAEGGADMTTAGPAC